MSTATAGDVQRSAFMVCITARSVCETSRGPGLLIRGLFEYGSSAGSMGKSFAVMGDSFRLTMQQPGWRNSVQSSASDPFCLPDPLKERRICGVGIAHCQTRD